MLLEHNVSNTGNPVTEKVVAKWHSGVPDVAGVVIGVLFIRDTRGSAMPHREVVRAVVVVIRALAALYARSSKI
eukprot:CAMPEP_0179438188 /NCGR_PEP_ID=MMETSP0799-20121207/21957_1 /TAXON_ID=46947 /ORGANISM="Geminigera cryophila, Strain CCMP2564" /LENGTH=73 /DNA_ID=CAMNT_0021219627 /DNA_START=481 /DNA_END=702 /DNA_ORIENTATION=+